VYSKLKRKPRKHIRRYSHKVNSKRKMVVELWLNLELLESKHLASEEKEKLIRDIINTIERKGIIEGKEGLEIDYLKLMN
jgi:hypothetical protein